MSIIFWVFDFSVKELKHEISQLKDKEKPGKCDSSEQTLMEILKSQICILQEQNSFIKSELQQKQIIIEKLLDIHKKQIKITVPVMESIKVTKDKLKQVIVKKWFVSLVK